ncbi:transglutaminase-like cysteine peptidase [Alphaproteobacteria bacterium]|nr:transglutaminase-like cysteine peptidase [Alphaproteobacteria bacterium]
MFSIAGIRSTLGRTRLGELLVSKGVITTSDLKRALHLQKSENRPLGEIFIESNMVSRPQLARILVRQNVLRCAATFVLGVMSLSSLGSKRAWAEIQDVPAKMSISFNSSANQFTPVSYFPAVLGTDEKKSRNLKPFTKWTGMFDKFDAQLRSGKSGQLVAEWRGALKRYQGKDLKAMADGVNDFVNQQPYVLDNRNWDKSDYWATPIEFMERGGDCEDFAIAKYTALRALGVPEERLRLMIVQDTKKNIPHAVLVVYTDEGAFVLDNQIKTLVTTRGAGRYRPIYSINRTAWWLHTAPTETKVASR